MTCLINLLTACLFDPSNVYLTMGIESQLTNRDEVRVVQCYETAYCARRAYTGPMGTLKLGVTARLTESLTIDYGLAHRSYVNTTDDHGIEVAFVEMTWRPFR